MTGQMQYTVDAVNSSFNSISGVVTTLEDQFTDKYHSITQEQLIKEQVADKELHSRIEEAVNKLENAMHTKLQSLRSP